jgi:hypothetical protein
MGVEEIGGEEIGSEEMGGEDIRGEVLAGCWYNVGGGDVGVLEYKIALDEVDLGEDIGVVAGELDELLGVDKVPTINGRSTIINCDRLPSEVV